MILAAKQISFNSILVGILIVVIQSSCQPEVDHYIDLQGNAQGTTFQITYRDSLSRDFSKDIDSLFRQIDHSMSLWDSTSIISRINRNDSTAALDSHFIEVFTRALQIAEMTDGAFDITIGRLVRAWGFSIKDKSALPDSSEIAEMKKVIGYHHVSIQDDRIRKTDPNVQIDFNGIAQGYSVDLICDFLETQGLRNYLVEVGGEVRARGLNRQGTFWQVGIDKPIDTLTDGRPLQTIVSLQNKALATSGSYRHFLKMDGKKLSHVIDPTTGYPVDHSLVSVSVLADDCMTADAFATAFLVMGTEMAMKGAKEQGLEIYCIIMDEDGNFQTNATEDFFK